MSLFYHSTRASEPLVTSKQAIIKGLADDGGLFVSDELGTTSIDIASLVGGNYLDNAETIIAALLPDYSAVEISGCVRRAYGKQFDNERICPVSPLGQDWLLELWHGPTCAFKDVALQMLPQLMSCAQREGDAQTMIVTATSGDTGKAALDGFADVAGTGITVFYPADGVSDVQRLQMSTQAGANVSVVGVKGNFDDVQSRVKELFSDTNFTTRIAKHNARLSSANSINIGRLIPQIVYYFDAYAQLVRAGALSIGDTVDFCVPTGNFGNVLAGYYAKCMGLPVSRLLVASNTNDVLVDFINTGIYDRARPFYKTISPSMDILVSSNLERLLYMLSDGDCELVASLMAELAEKGRYVAPHSIMSRLRESFAAGRATEAETRAAISDSWSRTRTLIDTHTAVGLHVMQQHAREGSARVLLSTASPFKFSSDVLDALGQDVAGKDGFTCMDELAAFTGIKAPAQLSELRSKPVLHKTITTKAGMGLAIELACEKAFT